MPAILRFQWQRRQWASSPAAAAGLLLQRLQPSNAEDEKKGKKGEKSITISMEKEKTRTAMNLFHLNDSKRSFLISLISSFLFHNSPFLLLLISWTKDWTDANFDFDKLIIWSNFRSDTFRRNREAGILVAETVTMIYCFLCIAAFNNNVLR